ncbi:hypothetical protein [Burkholderia cenocepacia]|uniref:hypothetical protein n=1 Tax=Burkholderia cenocepacia TaxID=95486 RepID=UPI000760C856|nr:hypothetical protein [Burkholderia cenocepacia]
MKKLALAVAALSATMLAGCGGLNTVLADRYETVEMYHVFDARGVSNEDLVIKSVSDGIARNTNAIVQNRPLRMGAAKNVVPATPGRFDVVDVASAFQGTGLGNLMALSQGAGNTAMRVAKCDDAIWSAKATRNIAGSDNLNLYTCLYRYKGGYQLDIYAVMRKKSGGLDGVLRDATAQVMGTPEQWTNKTIVDIVRSMQSEGHLSMSYVEGQPAIADLPPMDKYDAKVSAR